MRVFIADTDITEYCDVTACRVVDAGTGESDRVEITLGADDFFSWKPCAGEYIRVEHDGLNTGKLPIALEMPGDGAYTVIAAAMPEDAARRKWETYEYANIDDVVRKLCGEYRYLGIDTSYSFRYAARYDESATEFIARLLTPQAGLCKWTNNGLYIAALKTLLERDTAGQIELRADGANFSYTTSDTARIQTVRVISPRGIGESSFGESGGTMIVSDAPVFSDMDALKWAQGALLKNNLGGETLEVGLDFNPELVSWGMYETVGPYTGRWLATRVEHDLIRYRTSVTLER